MRALSVGYGEVLSTVVRLGLTNVGTTSALVVSCDAGDDGTSDGEGADFGGGCTFCGGWGAAQELSSAIAQADRMQTFNRRRSLIHDLSMVLYENGRVLEFGLPVSSRHMRVPCMSLKFCLY
jgi:hypothetical protein